MNSKVGQGDDDQKMAAGEDSSLLIASGNEDKKVVRKSFRVPVPHGLVTMNHGGLKHSVKDLSMYGIGLAVTRGLSDAGRQPRKGPEAQTPDHHRAGDEMPENRELKRGQDDAGHGAHQRPETEATVQGRQNRITDQLGSERHGDRQARPRAGGL